MRDKKSLARIIETSWFLPVLCGFIAFILYEMTNATGLYWGDPGEFLSAAYNLGIGHAYGHPFFWLLGRFSILIYPGAPAAAMNHLVAFFSAVTVSAIALFARQSCLYISSSAIRNWIIVSVTLFYASIPVIWSQATFIEVYNIQALFVVLSVFSLNQYIFHHSQVKYLYLFAFLWGISISLGLYLALLGILPVLYLIFYRKQRLFTFSKILLSILFGLLGLSIWIYFPIRSMLSPDFFRENINSMSVFLEYLGRKDFMRNWVDNQMMMGYVIQSSFGIFIKNLGFFGCSGLILFLISLFSRKKENPLALPYTLTVFILFIAYTLLLPLNLILIQLIDMDVYFIPIFILMIPLLVHGLYSLKDFLKTKWAILILLPILLASVFSYSSIDKSNHQLTENFKDYLINTLPEDVTLVAASDAVFHQSFTSVFVDGNPGNISVDDKGLKTTYDRLVAIEDTTGVIYEIDRQFIDSSEDLTKYALGGIFLLFPQDSLIAHRLEQEFFKRFHFEESDKGKLTREDRINFGLLFMNRAAYWWEIWKAQPMPRDNYKAKQAVKEALLAYHMTIFLDDFSYIGAFASGQIAMIYTLYNQLDQAEAYAKKALEIHPLTASAYRTLSLVEKRRQNFEGAMKYLSQLMAVSKDKERILIDKAFLYLYFKHEDDARITYQEALQMGVEPHPDLNVLLENAQN